MLLGLFKTNEIESPEVRILKKARSLINWGWCKFAMERHKLFFGKEYCIMGALRAASGYWSEPCEKVTRIIGEVLPEPFRSQWNDISLWNDRSGTTKKDVLEVFDKAIAKEQARCKTNSTKSAKNSPKNSLLPTNQSSATSVTKNASQLVSSLPISKKAKSESATVSV